MRYTIIRGARKQRVRQSSMQQRSLTPPPDSRRTRTTQPPSPEEKNEVLRFEAHLKAEGEEAARLYELAQLYGVNAVR